MKFLVDAQLPRTLGLQLRTAGHEAVHTLELPMQNRTTDSIINEITLREERVLITKDSDFVNSFLLQDRPYKLLLLSTGNITNADLANLFTEQLDWLTGAFETYNFIEMSRDRLIIHG